MSILTAGIIFSQNTTRIPFDWSGQNGVYIEKGYLFTNQSWYSGVLSFDGTYTSFPDRYGGHSSDIEINEIGQLPKFRSLPDSSSVKSFFDYYRGDYGLDKLDLGVRYHSKNQLINISGFKRSSLGNYGHYIHPTKSGGPIHQSYRIDYSNKSLKDRIEVSAARFITSSGIPDIIQNGIENDNIVTSGINYERNLETWKIKSYYSQFAQNRTLTHSLYTDSTSRFINRNQLDLQLANSKRYEFGFNQKFQQFNSSTYLRSIAWSSFYMRKHFANLSIMAGIQISENELYQPYIYSVNYHNSSKFGTFNIHVLSESQSAHPDANKSFSNDFESKSQSTFNYKISKNKLSLNTFFTDVYVTAKNFYDYNISLFGLNIAYSFLEDWSVYYKNIIPASTSQENMLGLIINSGLKGRFMLFQNNMDINFHIWTDNFKNTNNSFSYDPFLQYYSLSSENNFAIINRNLMHLEIQSNISGVLLHYRIYNLLNALGVENQDTFFKPSAIYPEIGRMMQFGVTWHFDN